ncbi:MAG TPA: phage holin family protein [Chthoniobacterales bacterium]|nr:phage holin family protein [Chthoniobacterales bacterium]
MAFQDLRSRNPAGHGGLIGSLLALVTDFASLAESRLALLVRESKTALVQIIVLAACLLAALLFVSLGYIFLVVSIVFGVAQMVQTSWIWIALIAAGVHFLLALIAVMVARMKMSRAPFPELAGELKKDREWLKNLDVNSRPTN